MNMLRSLSHDTKKCDTHVHTSFLQPPIRLKHLGELTQLVLETISQVSEQDVDETTVNRIGLSFWMKRKYTYHLMHQRLFAEWGCNSVIILVLCFQVLCDWLLNFAPFSQLVSKI